MSMIFKKELNGEYVIYNEGETEFEPLRMLGSERSVSVLSEIILDYEKYGQCRELIELNKLLEILKDYEIDLNKTDIPEIIHEIYNKRGI